MKHFHEFSSAIVLVAGMYIAHRARAKDGNFKLFPVGVAMVICALISLWASAVYGAQPCGAYIPPQGCSEVEKCTCPDGNTECTSTITCWWRADGQSQCSHTLCEPGTAPPPVLHRMSPQVKESLNTWKEGLDATAAFTSVTAAMFAAGGDAPAAAFFGISVAAMTAASTLIDQAVKHDPPDLSYTKIFPLPRPKAIPSDVHYPPFRRLLRNEFLLEAHAKRLAVTVDRANSAMQAGDQISEDKQQGVLDRELHTIGSLFRVEATLRQALTKRLAAHENPITDPAIIQLFQDTAKGLMQ